VKAILFSGAKCAVRDEPGLALLRCDSGYNIQPNIRQTNDGVRGIRLSEFLERKGHF
jgi:hypothetical protein